MVIKLYQHYKGGIYQVIDENAIHTETSEELVIYKNLQGQYFARPKSMFFEMVVVDGKEVPRFKYLGVVNVF